MVFAHLGLVRPYRFLDLDYESLNNKLLSNKGHFASILSAEELYGIPAVIEVPAPLYKHAVL